MSVGKNSISRVAGAEHAKKSPAKSKAPEKKASEPVVIPVDAPLSTEITIAAAPKKKGAHTSAAPKATKPASPKQEKSSGKVTTFCAPGEDLPVYLL